MSELGNLLKKLRGKASQAELAKASGVSARTLVRAENGHDVALSTVRTLAKHFKVREAAYANLLKAWALLQLGEDARLLTIESRLPYPKGAFEEFEWEVRGLSQKYQKELSAALKRKEVLDSLETMNRIFEAGKKHK